MPDYITQFGIDDLQVPLIIHSSGLIKPEVLQAYGSLPDLLPTVAGLFPQEYLNTTLGRDLASKNTQNLPAYVFIQDIRESVMFNGLKIGSINHITGETKFADIDEQGKAHYTDTPNGMADAANAYYTAAQYLLRANVRPVNK